MILTKVDQNVIYTMAVIVRKFKNFCWFSFLLTRQNVNMAVVVPFENILRYTMVFRYITWCYMVNHDVTW